MLHLVELIGDALRFASAHMETIEKILADASSGLDDFDKTQIGKDLHELGTKALGLHAAITAPVKPAPAAPTEVDQGATQSGQPAGS